MPIVAGLLLLPAVVPAFAPGGQSSPHVAGVVGGERPAPRGAAQAQTLDDLDDARDEVARLDDALDEANARYEAVWADIERTRSEIVALQAQRTGLAEDAAQAEEALAERARLVFMRGATNTVETLIASEDPQATVERAAMIAALQLRDRIDIEDAAATRAALSQTVALIEERQADLEVMEQDLAEVGEALSAELASAQAEADQIATLVSRQRRIERGAQQGIYACIFDQGAYRFRDTWGAPRSGGRSHRGTDVFAAFRAPVYAITSGVVQRHSRSALGGIGLYLRGDDGNVYYYAHLDSIDATGAVGRRVTAGEQIARNGSTGNASRSAPHVHFELHPGGGAAINPYPWLAAACF
ncbi:MAG: peptidoglycan DD-metalloendopeptidase family protein [Nitriliruptoraceae bacterium]|nr:peptidoglycan DD-metalloendopeptidase family protein [Nitriliruptoraceae bacterium]